MVLGDEDDARSPCFIFTWTSDHHLRPFTDLKVVYDFSWFYLDTVLTVLSGLFPYE